MNIYTEEAEKFRRDYKSERLIINNILRILLKADNEINQLNKNNEDLKRENRQLKRLVPNNTPLF